MSLNVKTITLRIITSLSGRFIMDLQIKLFSGLDRGNHVITITRGSIDIEGFREIFRNVAEHNPLAHSLQGSDRSPRRHV